jgi:hypothetical protein
MLYGSFLKWLYLTKSAESVDMRDDFGFKILLSPIDIKIAYPCKVDMRHARGSHRSDENQSWENWRQDIPSTTPHLWIFCSYS